MNDVEFLYVFLTLFVFSMNVSIIVGVVGLIKENGLYIFYWLLMMVMSCLMIIPIVKIILKIGG